MRLYGLIGRCLTALLNEGYGKTMSFDYDNWQNDPTPRVLQLGHWVHPSTGNTLVGGINLNYLSDNQINSLRYYLPDILKDRKLKTRYHSGKRLLPDVFGNFYRTYNRRHINVVEPGSLSFLTPKELNKQGDKERARKLQQRRNRLSQLKAQKAQQRGLPPEELPPEELPPSPEGPTGGAGPSPGADGGMPPEDPGVPTPPVTPTDRAREAVKSQQAQRMLSRIDDKLKQSIEAPPIPPPEPEIPVGPPEPPPVQPPPPKRGQQPQLPAQDELPPDQEPPGEEDMMPPDEEEEEELPPENDLPIEPRRR